MPQHVPKWDWSEDALRLRQFVFEFWCDNGRGPNYRNVHEALGLTRRQIIQAYKELQLGIVVVVDEDAQNCNLIKAPPFSSFPSQVELYIDDEFHSWVGCASEAMAVSNMPPFQGKDCRLESYCVCCLEPITIVSNTFQVQSSSSPDIRLHISTSPWDWVNVDMERMCDSMNFVLGPDHAERYERMTATRGILATLDQGAQFSRSVGEVRMHDYHWPMGPMDPAAVIERFRSFGVDVSPWGA
jgi:hypothetical protein